MVYDLIVVGGGPAGIFASIFAKERGKKVLLLEKMEKLGKKLLIAGSGQCNLTHIGSYKEFLNRYGENGKFLKRALYKYPAESMLEFFKGNNLELVARENGKYFPHTSRSLDVLALLKRELKGVEVRLNSSVERVDKQGDKFLCFIKDDKFEGKNLLIATGGLSYDVTGSTGDGYRLGKYLGHSVEELAPCLTPCYVNDYNYADLSGLSFKEVHIELYRGDKKLKEHKGDILFTHKNLSGPGIIDFSRYMKSGDRLIINFTSLSRDEFEKQLRVAIDNNGTKILKNVLMKLNLTQRFAEKELKLLKIDGNKKCAEVNKVEVKEIIKQFCQKSFVISRLEGYNVAMATKGGICLTELNKNTLESKKVKGLYFAGEVIDIDGDTGGFNIQAAYSMGALVAESI